MVFIVFLSGFDAAVDETSPSAPLAQPPPLSRGGFGMSVSFRLNKQSLFVSWAVVLRCPGQRQLDKVRLSRSCCPLQQGPPFCAILRLRRPVGSGPACQGLSLWERWHAAGVTERASQLRQSRRTAMSRLFCQNDTIAVLSLLREHPCPLRRFAPLPGLRLPASASLPLASCWPRPQQLLPVSATGGGRRRCSQRGEPFRTPHRTARSR